MPKEWTLGEADDLAEEAYQAYGKAYKAVVPTGQPWPEYDRLPELMQHSWRAAATRVADVVSERVQLLLRTAAEEHARLREGATDA